MTTFSNVLTRHRLRLRRGRAQILQINVGKLCNQTCVHCHVGAGPDRTEIMTAATARRIIDWMREHPPETVDITGGAPELCPEFRPLVQAAREFGAHVMVRCNLTVIFENGQSDLPEFFRDHGVEVIASLPCYSEKNVDMQRGRGVFDKSIDALKRLNALGYGIEERLPLTLVYNPVGPNIAPAQGPLEDAYRKELRAQFGIEFTGLVAITNIPITRFKKFLEATGCAEEYQQLLIDSFNPATIDGLMCRDTINVGWEGDLFDCDFNQMIDLPMGSRPRRFLWDIVPRDLDGEPIATGSHCFGCTAGHGSSCGGALA